MSSVVSTPYTSVTDRQTDGQTPHNSIYRAMHTNHAVMKTKQRSNRETASVQSVAESWELRHCQVHRSKLQMHTIHVHHLGFEIQHYKMQFVVYKMPTNADEFKAMTRVLYCVEHTVTRGGQCSSVFCSSRARSWIHHGVCDAWPVWRQTYSCLPSHTALAWLIGLVVMRWSWST